MMPFHAVRDDSTRWPTIPVVSERVWHAVGVGLSAGVAATGLLASVSTHEVDRAALTYDVLSLVGLGLLWLLVRPRTSRWPLLVWPFAVLAGLAGATGVAPAAAALCGSTIVLGFLYAGLTQPRGTSLLLLPFALANYLLINRYMPTDQLVVRAAIVIVVWVAAAELPAWLTVRLRLARSELSRLAATDPLTGLANRRYWDEQLTAMLERGADPAVLLVDLDHFKRFNDQHGHLTGDQMLTAFGRVVEQAVAPGDVAARWGGEEFAIAVREPARAVQVAEQIRGRVPFGQTCSIGLVERAPGEAADDLMRRVDAALYRAKMDGRDRVVAA